MTDLKLQPVRGTRDILGEDMLLHNHIVATARSISQVYNYKEISTPIFEFSEVFHRSIGEETDIISKETYTFLDREKTSITLRPEFTAGIVRALISNGLVQSIPLKFFSTGPVFRHERPQKCRYRQFNQLNFELMGPQEPISDAEIIMLALDLMQGIGLKDNIIVEINSLGDAQSRSTYRQKLVEYLEKYQSSLSQESKVRLTKNPLRILDSKDEGDRKILVEAPTIEGTMTDTAKGFFATVLETLENYGVQYKVNRKLVRGLDYYTHTVFEFTTEMLGSQGTVLAGGRYDGLVEIMGGSPTPAIGFAAGVERLAELMKANSFKPPLGKTFYLLPIGINAEKEAMLIAHQLRQASLVVEMDFSGNVSKRMKRANKINSTAVILFGDEELKQSVFKVKDMASGHEMLVEKSNLINTLSKI